MYLIPEHRQTSFQTSSTVPCLHWTPILLCQHTPLNLATQNQVAVTMQAFQKQLQVCLPWANCVYFFLWKSWFSLLIFGVLKMKGIIGKVVEKTRVLNPYTLAMLEQDRRGV